MNKELYNITVRLCKSLYPDISIKIYVNPFFKLLVKLVRTQGLIKTTKYLKACRLHCTRYMCGQPLLVNKLKIGIDSTGWPKSLLFLKPLVNGNLQERKFLMTILTLSRTLVLGKKERAKLIPDYDSITKPGKIMKIIPTGFIKEFVNKFKLQLSHPKFETKNIFLSNKAGPSGKATLSAMKGLFSYSYDLIASLFKIRDQSGIDYFTQQYGFNFEKIKEVPGEWNPLGKLAFIYDPECKLRIIAIVDYYTQLFLKPIHSGIMQKLRNIPNDRTYTQDPFHNWTANSEQFWSLDL